MSLKKGIVVILGANIINLIFQLLTNFLIPKFLSVDCYAEVKSFQLYVSYSGLLHLGYVDGMYIKFGGRGIDQIDRRELSTDLSTLLVFQVVLTGCLLAIASGSKNWTLTASALAILPLNIAGYYKLLFQATGEFEYCARVSNVTTILTFLVNMGLLLVRCFTDYRFYMIAYVVVDFVVMFLCAYFTRKCTNGARLIQLSFSTKCFWKDIQNGIFLMLGNFSSMILTGMDRWFIKALMDNTAFAMYSFAVSMENLMNVAVTPVSTTLYNYFCVHKEEKNLKNIKGKIFLFAAAIVACAFPAKFILETFLTKYLGASDVIFYLFGAQIFYIIVKCFYVNLYKAQKRQKIYFVKLTAVIVVGFLFNAGLYALMHTKEAFAIGTMLCGVVWYFLSEMDFKTLRSGWRENLFLLLATVSYLLLGTFAESLIGLLLYVCLLLAYSTLLMRRDIVECFVMAKEIIRGGKC